MNNYHRHLFVFRDRSVVLFLSVTISLITFSGCVTVYSVISSNTARSILPGAKRVIVYSDLPADSLYQHFFHVLTYEDFAIGHSSNKMRQITANGALSHHGWDFGSLTVNILINDEPNGSRALLTGTYYEAGNKLKAEWEPQTYYPFAYLVKIAQQVNGNIMYSK